MGLTYWKQFNRVKLLIFLSSVCCYCLCDDLTNQTYSDLEDSASDNDTVESRGLLPSLRLGQDGLFSTSFFSTSFDPESTTTSWTLPTTPYYDLKLLNGTETVYFWNTSTISAKTYQQSVCLQRCLNGIVVNITTFALQCSSVKCMPCSCERPACELYSNCCPDITEPYIPPPGLIGNLYTKSEKLGYQSFNATSSSVEIDNDTSPDDISPNDISPNDISPDDSSEVALGCDVESSLLGYNFIYIRSCRLKSEDMKNLERLCEQELPLEEIDADVVTRVIDDATGTAYRNKYCAQCNGVERIVSFKIDVRCQHYMKVYQATATDQLLRMIVANGDACQIKQVIPRNAILARCYPSIFFNISHKVIDSCDNASPSWSYDERIAMACRHMNRSIYRVARVEGDVYYKNIFCAICHENSYPWYKACRSPSKSTTRFIPPLKLPLQLLINFGSKTIIRKTFSRILSPNVTVCSQDEWTAPNGQCFSLLCAPGKKLINGKCSTVLSEIKGLGYSLRLWLMSSTEIPKQVRHALPFIPHSYLFDRLRTKLNDYLVNIMDSSKINISLITAASDRLDDRRTLRKPVVFLLSGHIVASQDLGRDEFEGALTDALLSPWKNLSLANGVEAEFIPSLSLRSNNSLCETIFVPSHGKISCGVSEVSPNVTSDENAVLWNVRDSFLNVSHLLSCSFVAFNKSHFNRVITDATIPTTVKIIVNFGDNKITFQDPADMNYMHIGDDGKLNVCRDLLDKYVHSSEDVEFLGLSQGNGDDENRAAQYVLTMVCMGTSILSLLMTLFTYLRFPVLLTTAGRNNACLSLSLLLAQASLIASTHLSAPSALCTAMGVLTHSCWLWTFTWTFICSFNMFRIFTAKTRITISSQQQNLQLFKTIAGSLACPVCVVAIVIVASHLTSDGTKLGYGDGVCYLDTTLLLGLSLVLPLALFLTCNMVFFLTTVISIYRIHKLQSSDKPNSSDKKNLFIYIKLSSMTGTFWIMAIVSEATDSDVLRYISILFNGLQGVFVFVSFMCNKRVLHLYTRRHVTTSSGSRRETTQTADQEDSFKLKAKVASAMRFVQMEQEKRENV